MSVAPTTPSTLTARTAARMGESVAHTEGFDRGRYNQSPPSSWSSQRGEHRHAWPVKVTGSPAGGTPLLWPAVLRYYERDTAADTNTWPSLPTGAAVWVVPVSPAGATPVTDKEYLGTFVGYAEERAVYAVTETGGGGAGETTDVNVVLSVCPVKDGSGKVTAIHVRRQTLRVPTAWLIGDPTCETDPAGCCDGADVVLGGGCDFAYPAVMVGTWAVVSGGSPGCLDGGSVTVTYNAAAGRWEGTYSGCGSPLVIYLTPGTPFVGGGGVVTVPWTVTTPSAGWTIGEGGAGGGAGDSPCGTLPSFQGTFWEGPGASALFELQFGTE